MPQLYVPTLTQWFKQNEDELLTNLIAGSFAGIATCLAGYPLDTIKVRMQMSSSGMINNIHNIIHDGGFKAFYKGMGFPITTVPIFTAVNFTAYELSCSMLKNNLNQNLEGWKIALSGGIAGMAQSFLSTPVELTKIRLQIQSQSSFSIVQNGPINTVKNIIRNEGIQFLYRGYVSTLLRETFAFGAQFYFYEMTKRFLQYLGNKQKNTQTELFIAGGVGGIGCWVFSYPQDLIKTRIQTDSNILQHYRLYKPKLLDGGFSSCMTQIVNEKGYRGLYSGFSPCLIRAFVANAFGFIAFEEAKSFLRQNQY